jgi:colicin import membrane protein
MTRGRAIGPGNTLGHRAGACNQKLACIFRDVDLGLGPQALQPIDLRVMRHDRREPVTIITAGRCDLAGSELFCADTIKSRTWRAWIVPESVAERVGAETLTRAVEAGLPSSRSAELQATVRQ